jgi:NADPH:quinone reductase-like Zn-dependent oxidoreductase
VKAGDNVLLLGTGGVSLFALQFTKTHGARVILTSSSDEKLAIVRELGADETINYMEDPHWDKAVSRLAGRPGADVVIEVAGAGTLDKSLASVRVGGTVCFLGVLTGVAGPVSISPRFYAVTYEYRGSTSARARCSRR